MTTKSGSIAPLMTTKSVPIFTSSLWIPFIGAYSMLTGVATVLVGFNSSLLSSIGNCGIGLLLMVCAYGLLAVRSWGAHFGYRVYAGLFAMGLLLIIPDIPVSLSVIHDEFLPQLIGLIVDAAVCWYLQRPSVDQYLFLNQRSVD
jgi:hypothetical protein